MSSPEDRLTLVRAPEDGSVVKAGAVFLRIPFRKRRAGLLKGDRVP
ncbi:hypothetical protein [Nocardia fluminea]|nr:hypothetical protein [Nocardia fluminea]